MRERSGGKCSRQRMLSESILAYLFERLVFCTRNLCRFSRRWSTGPTGLTYCSPSAPLIHLTKHQTTSLGAVAERCSNLEKVELLTHKVADQSGQCAVPKRLRHKPALMFDGPV